MWFWWVFLIVAVFVLVWLGIGAAGRGRGYGSREVDSAEEALRLRYARGEITRDEYERMLHQLRR